MALVPRGSFCLAACSIKRNREQWMKTFSRRAGAMVLFISLSSAASPALADAHPKGFSNHPFNAVQPATAGGVTAFTIHDKQCSKTDYGDGRGESDCLNGNVRSNLAYGTWTKLNQSVEYRFDIWMEPSFNYRGFFNSHATGYLLDSMDSRLRLASWEGPLLHNFIYILKADKYHGITFLGEQCQSPGQFGQWVTFAMKIRWASDKTGWIQVSCDDRVIYARDGLATTQAPHCYITNQCEPGAAKNPKRFLFIAGPVMSGFGHEWQKYSMPSQFTNIQPEGITVKMRKFSVAKIKKPAAIAP